MTRNLSALGLLWISLTSMIGSGWLFGSLYSAHFAGPAAILAWPIAGVLLLLVAFSYAEVSTMFPEKNSLALLPLYTHGHLASVFIGFLTWISLATIPAIETQGLVQYASNYLPGLMLQQRAHYIVTPLGYVVALGLLASFVLLNYFGIRLFSRINTGFTVWKLLIPTITIVALLSFGFNKQNFTEFGGFMPYGWHGVMTAMSNGGILFSLLGFRQVVIMISEVNNPGKYVPIVLVSSLLLTTLLYTALQLTFIGTIHASDLLHGWTNLSFPGDAGPFAALAALVGMIWLSSLLYIDAFISPYSTGLVYSTTAAQMLASMGSVGDVPQIAARKNKYNIPYLSLLVNFILGAVIFTVLNGWQEMAAFAVAVVMITYSVGPISLVCLRKQLPDHPRPFRLRSGYLIAFLGFYVCMAGVYWAGLINIIKLLVLITLSMLFYFIYHSLIKNSQKPLDGKNALWMLIYLLSFGIFSYFGNYGGNHFIPPYWDLLYLMGLSFIIFILAFVSRKSCEHTQSQIDK